MIDALPATRLAPWLAEPRQLWSLFDMLRFYGASFVTSVSNIERAFAILAMGINPDYDEENRARFVSEVADLNEAIKELPVSGSLRAQAGRFAEAVGRAESVEILNVRLDELRHNLLGELTDHLFLCVPTGEKWLYLEPEKTFWTVEVAEAFPEARQDMRECSRALALDLSTASVFHAMRVVQHGLHRLADRVGVSFTKDIDVLNWNEIIQGIEKKLKVVGNEPKTPNRDAELQFCTAASSHFFAIKEAWRDYVMHGRSTYDSNQARVIKNAVGLIMKALA